MRVLIAILMLLPMPALAQGGCGGTTQLDMNFCAREKWEAADAELNRLWAVVKPAADARGQGAALLDAQRAWLARRDATCEAERARYEGGSAAAMFYFACMEEMTRGRNAELRAMR